MPTKSFEQTLPFVDTLEGWQPLVQVTFVNQQTGRGLTLPLLFDTGADQICLHPDYEWFFPALTDSHFRGVGNDTEVDGKNARGQIEFLGKTIECDIGFTKMERRTWMAGVVGRECFKPFGFGFWESSREIYVTSKP